MAGQQQEHATTESVLHDHRFEFVRPVEIEPDHRPNEEARDNAFPAGRGERDHEPVVGEARRAS